MKTVNENEIFRTSDLSLAAAIYLYIPIEFTEKADSRRVVFAFKHSQQIDQLVQAFWRNELNVNPRSYFESLKSIKSLIRQ